MGLTKLAFCLESLLVHQKFHRTSLVKHLLEVLSGLNVLQKTFTRLTAQGLFQG